MNEEKNNERSCSMEGNKGFVKVSSFLPSFLLTTFPVLSPVILLSSSSPPFSSSLSSSFSFFCFLFLLPLSFIPLEMFYCCWQPYTLYIHHIHGGLLSLLLRYVFLKRLMVRKGKIRILQPHSAA